MKITISTKIEKLGAQIPSLGLPAGKTCRPDAPCFKKCYARKGHYTFPSVKNALEGNLEAYKADPDYFFDYIAVNSRLVCFFRWFHAGDIVDDAFLLGMVRVARKNPNTRYLAFTKKFDIVNRYLDAGNKLPKNLKIVFSGWGASFKILNPHNLPTAFVRFDKEDNSHIPPKAFKCSGDCSNCQMCWLLRKGQSVEFGEH